MCGNGTLVLPAQPIYCSLCSRKIKDKSSYYIPEEKISDAQHQICNPCYNRSRKNFTLFGVTVARANMLKMCNADNQHTEEVNFISLCPYIYLSKYIMFYNLSYFFLWCSGFIVNLAKSGNIRYVVSTINKKTLTKQQTTFVPTVC